ncbi:shikimate dehydrogenase [Paenibacillus naphthalenovorans]|uniref:Shikimate dehydrogenase (NADP(+)) n=1 Tax=Paenibacillus naphthalenovorans TaxID=162209 RepID=A0A0U2KWX8_9BACL|nr:shikimate dehydrogenase [Paenibacillus naphthalenovorans]ALS21250.1 shikimate dehydrogenase [Paenibacillus naphthalenovorans]SDH98968.1 shikimate dehydrogenase [Paenibacillus naphthalenovorans]
MSKHKLDSHTMLYGVFGDPIRHSKSPIMLNRAFEETGLNAAYGAFHILPGTLKDAVAGIRALQFRGVNVTIPHKVEVMSYLDEIDEAARVIGAVNTIVNEGGKLIGYNTDGIGYIRSLKEETGIDLKGRKVLMIGAGGAARGVGYALVKEGVEHIWIANRTKEKALELAASMSGFGSVSGHGLDEAGKLAGEAALIVNNTLLGMHPNVDGVPMDVELIKPGTVVSDLVYNPLVTRFLREARDLRGATVHSGLGMFIYQGAYAFEYWTGLPAPVAAMREAVLQSFEERQT